MTRRTEVVTVGQLKKFFDDNKISDGAVIVMYNSLDEGDCFMEAARYYAPGEKAESDYCKADSVFDAGFQCHNGSVILFG